MAEETIVKVEGMQRNNKIVIFNPAKAAFLKNKKGKLVAGQEENPDVVGRSL